MDVRDILDSKIPHLANRVALVHRDRQFTYQALHDEVTRLSCGLSKHHAAGDLLAIWLPNGPEIICLYLACLKTGIVPVPLNDGMKWPEVRDIVRRARARTLIASAGLIAHSGFDFTDTGLERIHVVGTVAPQPPCRPYAELTRDGSHAEPERQAEDGMAFVLHTSGSDGQPKGVMLSYRNLNHILDYRLGHTGLDHESVSVVASCLTQSVGLHQSLALLAAGGTMVLLESYDIERLVAAIHRHQPSHLIMVVDAFDRLLHHPAITSESLACVRFASVGADRVTARVQDRFIALTGRPLNVSYGMTESSWALVNTEGRHDKRLALGKPGPDIEIRLTDPDGREVPPGEVGEIRIRSPRTMLGYLHDDDLTRATIRDGWLASGDLAHRDGEGYFWFAGRRKHIIVLATGDNVSPVEVEQALLGHAGVARCLVVAAAVPGQDAHVVRAYVVRLDKALSEADLRGYLLERMSAFKIPGQIMFVEEIPVGLTGKIQRPADAIRATS